MPLRARTIAGLSAFAALLLACLTILTIWLYVKYAHLRTRKRWYRVLELCWNARYRLRRWWRSKHTPVQPHPYAEEDWDRKLGFDEIGFGEDLRVLYERDEAGDVRRPEAAFWADTGVRR